MCTPNTHITSLSPGVVLLTYVMQVNYNFVFEETAAMPYVHMGMIAELPGNTIAASFQGSAITEGCNDQAIFFTTSIDGGQTWSNATVAVSGEYACWG